MRLNTAQRLALNLDSHIVIDAGAGTGKTSTIVDRVIEHYLTEDQRATRLMPKPETIQAAGGLNSRPSLGASGPQGVGWSPTGRGRATHVHQSSR